MSISVSFQQIFFWARQLQRSPLIEAPDPKVPTLSSAHSMADARLLSVKYFSNHQRAIYRSEQDLLGDPMSYVLVHGAGLLGDRQGANPMGISVGYLFVVAFLEACPCSVSDRRDVGNLDN